MGNGKSVLLIGLILLVFACGCAKPVYQLPQSWPVQQLTLPPGSVIVTKPFVMHEISPFVPATADKHWSVYFDCSSANISVVVAHIEACLQPLNYSEYWIVNPRIGSSREAFRSYYSPDELTEVTIMPGTKQLGISGASSTDSEYILSIKITKAPARKLKNAGTTSDIGVKTYLEPIR